jgi:phenylpyruvate tautomerase PptA (4-oxalocrotonate tautomerase family)
MYSFQQEAAMPFVRISLKAPRAPQQRRRIADAVHAALQAALGIPAGDRFQIVETLGDDMIVDPGFLGVRRDQGAVFVEIHLAPGRSVEKKQALYKALAGELARAGVEPRNLFVHLVETALENWSFGEGVAQYVEKPPAHV